MKKRADGIFSENLESGTLVFDKAKDGELMKDTVFVVNGKEYETDSSGAIVFPKLEETKESFLNPFEAGVTYAEFLASIPEGVTLLDHVDGHLSQEQYDWLSNELEQFKKSK